MSNTNESRSCMTKTAGFIGGVAALITAITALAAAIQGTGLWERLRQPPIDPTTPPATIVAAPSRSPAVEIDPAEAQRPNLISAIRLANGATIRAQYTLDPSPLYDSFTGEALRENLAAIEQLSASGVALDSRLLDASFESFSVSADGSRAEVRVVETWSATIYAVATQSCVGQYPEHDVPQTVYLERGVDGWLVYAIVYDADTPEPVGC